MPKNNKEEMLQQFADAIENGSNNTEHAQEDTLQNPSMSQREIELAKEREAFNAQQREVYQERSSMTNEEAHEAREKQLRQEAIDSGTTLIPVRLEDLPSKGMFYPVGTQIYVRSARLQDIKRWTAMDEEDATDINTKINDILQSCCMIKFQTEFGVRQGDYKDLVDVDRMYLLFDIHSHTFMKGTNDIRVKISETEDVLLDMNRVSFIDFGEKLMKYYDANKRCFRFPVHKKDVFKKTDGMMEIYIPKLGVQEWLVNYVRICEQRRDNYDHDLVQYAQVLIKDWRGFDYNAYQKLADWTSEWSGYEWSLLSTVRDRIVASAQIPVLNYIDSGGVEHTAPLNFRDGFKSLFRFKLDEEIDL